MILQHPTSRTRREYGSLIASSFAHRARVNVACGQTPQPPLEVNVAIIRDMELPVVKDNLLLLLAEIVKTYSSFGVDVN